MWQKRLPNLCASTIWDKICWETLKFKTCSLRMKFFLSNTLYMQICRRNKNCLCNVFVSSAWKPAILPIKVQYSLLPLLLSDFSTKNHLANGRKVWKINWSGLIMARFYNLFRGAIHCSLTKLSFGQKLLLFFV